LKNILPNASTRLTGRPPS